jgi:hypothetical protein
MTGGNFIPRFMLLVLHRRSGGCNSFPLFLFFSFLLTTQEKPYTIEEAGGAILVFGGVETSA